jgi:hypothetical protein
VSKKFAFLFLTCSALIVLPVIRSVNIPADNTVLQTPSHLVPEGDPMPPPHKPCCRLIAEGDPMPPPHKPGLSLVAEGDPMPPPHKPGTALVAEGDPMPPPHKPGLSL